MRLIYHDIKSSEVVVSPFDDAIQSIVKNKKISIACPFISIDYLGSLIQSCSDFKLISDTKSWIAASKIQEREKIYHFLSKYENQVHNCERLHAKVILNNEKSIVGSANFTRSGILYNIELAVILEEKKQLNELYCWFMILWENTTSLKLGKVRDYIDKLPIKLEDISKNSQEFILSNNIIKINSIYQKTSKIFSAKNKVVTIRKLRKSEDYQNFLSILDKKVKNEKLAKIIFLEHMPNIGIEQLKRIIVVLPTVYYP